MQTPDTHVHPPSVVEDAHVTPQVESRLLHLDNQIAHLQGQVERLVTDAQDANSQVTALVRHLTDPQPLDAVHERLAELALQVETSREHLDALTGKMAELAGQEQLAELANTISKLGRTQFKSNALGETKEQQIERSLVTLQDMATRRDQIQAQVAQRSQQWLDDVRKEARSELAADLLPALDSVELALDSGYALVLQQRQEIAQWDQKQAITTQQEDKPPSAGAWQKLRRKWAGHPEPVLSPPPDRPCLPDSMTMMPDGMEAWLQGLMLVRDRFLALLAAEGIDAIPALDVPFDPHLHVAIEAETRDDVPPNMVVRVLRKGYRQHHRVLRYAEVIVARASALQQPVSSEPEDEHHA
jgi:molecular chaperone GrpE (heat shock protein)